MLVNLKQILWPTDFSELSRIGGRYARGLSEHFGAALHVIHVLAPVFTPDFSVLLPVNVPVAAPEPEMVQVCRENLAKIIAEQFGNDPRIVAEVLSGDPLTCICDYARQKQIDLIVVATHGRTGLEHALIGSTAERIVQHAPCPVLTMKSAGWHFLRD